MSLKRTIIPALFLLAISICAQDLSQFKHWSITQLNSIKAKPWRTTNDVVYSWDWSLPSGTVASPNAFVTIPNNAISGIPCRNLEQIWITWKVLEPTEGTYNWDLLRTEIAKSMAKGYSGVVLRVWGAVWDVYNYPDSTNTNTKWPIGTKTAPRWLRSAPYNVPLIKMTPSGNPGSQIVNCDIMNAVYHEKYKNFIRAFGASGIPAMPEVAIAYVCYRSHSMGEEFTKYEAGESTATNEEIAQRTKERIDVWVEAFGVNKQKLMYVAEDAYAGTVGIGTRGGIIENYNQLVNEPVLGQYIDANRYLTVDENNSFIKSGAPFGDENENYDPNDTRFGKPETIGYRYMMSTLMMLKMRRNFAMLNTTNPNPELLYWAGLEFGRTITDAPDAWCWLNECYVKWVAPTGPIKNVERWLIQRDSPGYETTPYYQVQNTHWYAEKPYDYVCRQGLKMGFALDDRLISEAPQKIAVKITYYDKVPGTLTLVYNDGNTLQNVSVKANGVDSYKTATFFITAACKAKGTAYDFEIQSPERVPINMVRVIPIDRLTSVNTTVEDYNCSVYPNPVSDIMNIKHNNGALVKIYNMQGVLLYSKKTTGSNSSIDVSKLNRGGFLLVQIISGNQTKVVKVATL